jgi:phage baseplate assembly protein W
MVGMKTGTGGSPSSWDAFTDAQAKNNIDRNVRQYSDLDLFFNKTMTSKDISKVTDIQAVKRSIRNLVLTNHYEKPFHPEIGSGVRDMLFEPMTPLTAHILTRKIEDVIENFEPRARLISVRAQPNLDRNEYECTIQFFVVNTPTELVDLTVFLERLR